MCGAPSTTRLGRGCGFSHLFEGDVIISITNVPPFSLFAVSSIDVQRWIVNGAINGVESVHILSANVNNQIRGKSEKARFRYQQCVCETNLKRTRDSNRRSAVADLISSKTDWCSSLPL